MIYDEILNDQNDSTAAEEGLFSHAPKPAQKMLEKAQKRINRCKTAEECDELSAKAKSEAEKFNDCMNVMKKAAEELKDGTITKDEFKAKIKPAAAELRKNCEMLKFGNIVGNHKNDLTDDDIANLHAFISGFHTMIAERKAAIGGNGGATESLISACEAMMINFDDEPALEGWGDPKSKMAHAIKYSKTRKLAKAAIKEASKLERAHDYDGAKGKYEEAKGHFKDLISQTKIIPDDLIRKITSPITETTTEKYFYTSTATSSQSKMVKTAGHAKQNLVDYLNKQIQECDARILKCKNHQDSYGDSQAKKEAKAAAKAAKHAPTAEESADEAFTFFDDETDSDEEPVTESDTGLDFSGLLEPDTTEPTD